MKRIFITGFLFVSILGTLLHFAYQWTGENFFAGLFVPVNESTWEHMKLIFFPMLIFTFLAGRKSPCVASSLNAANLLGTFLIPTIFYTYTGILGFHIAVLDILTFFVSTVIAFFMAYQGAKKCSFEKYKLFTDIFVLVLAGLFIIFTIFPPELALFVSPK